MTSRQSDNPPTPHVLTVDDEAVNLMVMEAALAPLGYRIEAAASAAEAMLAMRAEKPDLILLDVMMPGQSGIELCQVIRRDETLRDVPVMLVTALGAATARNAGLASGADDYVEKPIDIDDLTYRVRSLVGRTLGCDHSSTTAAGSPRRTAEAQALQLGMEEAAARRIGLEAMVHEAATIVGGPAQSEVLAAAMARAAGLPGAERNAQ